MKNNALFICLLLFVLLTVNMHQCAGQTTASNTGHRSAKTPLVAHTQVSGYAFKDPSDKDVRVSDFKGKYVVVDLWFTGCGACIMVNDALKAVHDSLKNENIVFLSISIDKDKAKWLQSITKNAMRSTLNNWAGSYCPAEGTVTLYTGGSGAENEFIKKYVPSGFYPQLLLISPTGEILSADPPRPDHDPKVLIDYIRHLM